MSSEAVREMTFEEEYEILQREKERVFASEKEGYEPPLANCVLRRALRCIDKLMKTSRREWYQKGYQDGLNADKWIPFNEPPKEDDTYIVAWLPIGLDCKARTKHYYALWDFENDEWEVDVPESYKNLEIIGIAYQPLPQPYKKEGAE